MSGHDDRDVDRELEELTSELRVLLAAATVLFAFLLTVPFSSRFAQVSGLHTGVYFVAFVSTAFAIVLLVGETAYHRLIGKPYDKARLVTTASRQAVGGIALLAIALSAVVFVVADLLYPLPAAAVSAAAVLSGATFTWFALPLLRKPR